MRQSAAKLKGSTTIAEMRVRIKNSEMEDSFLKMKI